MWQSSGSSVEGWESFNALAERTLSEDPLPKEDLNLVFLRIEELIFSGVNQLLWTTTFVEDNLCYLLAEIASGVIKSRKVYKGKRVRNRVPLTDEIEMGSENRRIFGIGFDLFKLSRMDRSRAVPLVKRIIRSLRISTSTYENILLTFAKECEDYCKISDELARTSLEIIEGRRSGDLDDDTLSLLEHRASRLLDEIDVMELSVGCVEQNFLYGTARNIRAIVRQVRRLQERVVRAYSRLTLKPVRERAQSEMEAFDLFQSGSLGLARAISLYDVRSGTSFPTFAAWWIRQKIFGSIKHSGPLIKLPGSVLEKYQQIKAAERELEADPKRRDNYTTEDIASVCGSSVKSVELVLKKMQSTKVLSLEVLSGAGYSGDSDDRDGGSDRAMMDESIVEEAELLDRQEFVDSILERLAPDQRNLVCLRFGIIDNVKTDIDTQEALRELFRQAACKSILQKSMAIAADTRLSVLRFDDLVDEVNLEI